MRTPEISVVLPIKNNARYIFDAIESVLTQTFADFELLVIDDGSTDATVAIISEFQRSDTRIRVLKNPGAGLVDALNYGVTSASAGLIARMDADDCCQPTRFQRQYDFLNDHPEVAVVGTQVTFIDEHGALVNDITTYPETPQAIDRMLLKRCCLGHPTVFFRREAFEAVGGYRNELVDAEDYDLWLRMAEHYALANLPERLVLYRRHSAQVSEQRKWPQRLSRNLALAATKERRRTGQDPIGAYHCFEKSVARQGCQGSGCAGCVCESVRVFSNAESILSEQSTALTRDDIRDMLRYLSRNTMGDGQRSRLLVLVALCREAARRRAPVELAAALGLALWSHPGRTVLWLATGGEKSRAA